MTINLNLMRLVVAGHFNVSQSWSVGFWQSFTPSGDFVNQANADAALTAMNTPVNTWVTSLKTLIWSNLTNFDNTALYLYRPGSARADLVSRSNPTAQSGSASTPHPPQCALVISTRSVTPGRSGRGRIYLPVTAGALGGDGQMAVATLNSVATATATFLSSLDTLDLTTQGMSTHHLVIASFTKGSVAGITRIVTDSVVDTQQRRRDKVIASSVRSDNVT